MLTLVALAILGLVGWVDYVAAPQMSFSIFYLVPVLIVAAGIGRTAGLLMVFACMLMWLISELLAPAGFIPDFNFYWNVLIGLGVFLIAAWLASLVREFHDALEAHVQQRIAALSAEVAMRRQTETQLRDLEQKVLEVSEREKRGLGEDLHDGLSQDLIGLAIAAKLVAQKLRDNRAVDAGQVEDIVAGINRAAARTRGLAQGLYPLQLERHGLTSALRDFCDEIERTFQIPCHFVCDPKLDVSDPRLAREFYRIAQEAVRNALKHAQPKNISVLLSQGNEQIRLCVAEDGTPADLGCRACTQKGQVTLCVADDGVGFPKECHFTGMGLAIMSYRARLLGAQLRIQRPPAGGTRVTCTLPLNRDPATAATRQP
jgi:signal transduction histidine kinase